MRQVALLAAIRACEERYNPIWGLPWTQKGICTEARELYRAVRSCHANLAGQTHLTQSQFNHMELLRRVRDPSTWIVA